MLIETALARHTKPELTHRTYTDIVVHLLAVKPTGPTSHRKEIDMSTRNLNNAQVASRRDILASAVVAASAASLGTAAASASSQDRQNSETLDTSARWKTEPGDLYNQKSGGLSDCNCALF